MDLRELGAYLFPDMRDLLRVEALDYYDADSDCGDFARWRAGQPELPNPGKTAWHDRLRTDTAAGITWRRLHVLSEPLTDYLLYECEWGYTGNVAAGEDVRILTVPDEQLADIPELFIVNDGERIAMSQYDSGGRFVTARALEHERRRWTGLSSQLWASATPFTTWWAARPHYHHTRTGRAA